MQNSPLLNRFKQAAEKAGIQATAFMKESGSRVAAESRGLAQSFSLPGEAEKCAKILESFLGKAGSGLVIARLPTGEWSAPSCIGTAGVGWGLQIGADITDFVIVLNNDDAVRAFSMGGNVTVGGNISATAGPIGTGAGVQTSLAQPAPMFSYSKSKGLFAGLSLDGTILIERKDANRDFYGSPIPARDILEGRVPPPEVASRMYEVIEAAEGLDESGVPAEAYYPGEHAEHIPVSAAGGYNVGAGGNSTVFDADRQ
ncbi:hypothetical protein FS837_000878 [Tulasnella sp. UAMH 9824]|nr:hypothetical protein FS837_000878 [Tulasnella sp. UAMH 9824]